MSGTTALVRYFRPSGTTAMICGTTAPVRARGDKDGQGEFNSPYPFAVLSLHVASFSPSLKNGAGVRRRISSTGCPPVIPSGGIVPHHVLLPWTKVFPQLPLIFVVFFASRFLGETCVF